MRKYWLIKSEPSELSIDDMVTLPNQTIEWFGIRNYQARNFMLNEMQEGDLALFWHSSCKEPGIYGIVSVVGQAHPDSHQFDVKSKYFDAKAKPDKPIWWCVDFKYIEKTKFISIKELRLYPELAKLQVLKKGNRLSISRISENEWVFIQKLLKNSV